MELTGIFKQDLCEGQSSKKKTSFLLRCKDCAQDCYAAGTSNTMRSCDGYITVQEKRAVILRVAKNNFLMRVADPVYGLDTVAYARIKALLDALIPDKGEIL